MDMPRNDDSPKKTIDWNKQKEHELSQLSGFMVRRRPVVMSEEKLPIAEPEKKPEATPTEELPSLQRVYTRGQMTDLLMEFPHMTAKWKHYIVKYNSSGHFYGVNEYFDFSLCSRNEEWIVWE